MVRFRRERLLDPESRCRRAFFARHPYRFCLCHWLSPGPLVLVRQLRNAVEHTTASLFYRAAVEASANDLKAAQRDLHAVIDAAPHSAEAYEAHDLLGNMYFRNGMYRGLFREITAALHEKPDAGDAKSIVSYQGWSSPLNVQGKAGSYFDMPRQHCHRTGRGFRS